MKTSPKDFFLHLGIIAGIYVVAISFINLAWKIIDYVFPREDIYYGFYQSSISVPVATLIVVFPIFIFLSWLLNKEYSVIPEKRDSWVRKWLIYITLFVAGIVIVTDLITVLIQFLSGNLITAGFALKALTVFITAGAIFTYYIADLRGKTPGKINKASAWFSGLIILGLIVSGFSIIGSPRTQRLLNYDSQKISDLQNIQIQVINFWQQKGGLPTSLSELDDSISGFRVPTDRQSGESYEYEKSSELSFRLCAEFNLESRGEFRSPSIPRYPIPFTDQGGDYWNHGEGRECFEREIDPELHPPRI